VQFSDDEARRLTEEFIEKYRRPDAPRVIPKSAPVTTATPVTVGAK
jgi:hypothetical protein